MEVGPTIQWFPGHMAKTRRMIKENLRHVDLIVEVLDARIPYSSANPELTSLISNKPRIVLLNKFDMANEAATERWLKVFKGRSIEALAVDCKSGKGLKSFKKTVETALAPLILRREQKGISGMPLRLMIVGIPNVGKSSLINRLCGRKSTKVEDRPGVTRGKQWVSLQNGMEFLDMPGVLWPKFQDKTVAEHLAFTGSVKDQVLDIEALAMRLCEVLAGCEREALAARYKLKAEDIAERDGYEILNLIALARGMLKSGGQANLERAAITVLDEYRAGAIGRITLELPRQRVSR